MKKKLFLLLALLFFLVACSSNSNNDNNTNNNNENNTENNENQTAENEENDAPESLESEVLFSYDHENSGDYDIQSIGTDANGTAITFTGKEDIDRKTDYYTYFIDQNDNVIEGLELAEDEEQDRRCTDLSVSPNGDYLVYNCHDDGIAFSVYDMHEEETIHQMEEPDDYIRDIHGITNDKIVYYDIENDDYETELVAYDAEADDTTSYVLDDLIDLDDDSSFDRMILSDDGKYILINAYTALYLIDVEDKSAEEITNVEEQTDEYDADIFIYDEKMSPDAKYVYYKISENDSDPVYGQFFFHNLDTDEVTAFGELDYQYVRGFDVNGNVLLEGDDELTLYNIESEETRIIPEVEVGTYTGYFTLSHNGEYLIYTDKDSNDDDTYTQNLIRVSLGDISSYEMTELEAQEETVKEEPDQAEITLTEENFDEEDILVKLWEDSTDFMFPTEFPDKVERKTNQYSGDEDDRRFSQTIYMESDSARDNEVNFTAQLQSSSGRCVGFDDLDQVDTIDGDDYYFYDYRNKDVEAAVSVDDECYSFEAEEHSEDDMLEMAQSLKPIDEPFHDISLDGLKFPTQFPSEKPRAASPRVISYNDGEKVDFLMNYYGDRDDRNDNDIKMEFEIRTHEPTSFRNRDNEESVDIDGFDESYFSEDHMTLTMYDGTHYYVIKLDINNDMLQAYGSDQVEETFIEIGNSLK